MRTMSTEVCFDHGDFQTTFVIGQPDDENYNDQISITLKECEGHDDGGENGRTSCQITLDEAEYVARMIRDAVEYRRSRLGERESDRERSAMEIERAIEWYGGDLSKAAHELGISRRTLYRRMKEFGIKR